MSFRITLHTPRTTAHPTLTSRLLDKSSFIKKDIPTLKTKHRKTKTETDALVFWDQVENYSHL